MKKSELWAQFAERYPAFDGEGSITMTARGLRKLFHTTWDIAHLEGEDEAPAPASTSADDASLERLKSIFRL